jgi:hypothetical protein
MQRRRRPYDQSSSSMRVLKNERNSFGNANILTIFLSENNNSSCSLISLLRLLLLHHHHHHLRRRRLLFLFRLHFFFFFFFSDGCRFHLRRVYIPVYSCIFSVFCLASFASSKFFASVMVFVVVVVVVVVAFIVSMFESIESGAIRDELLIHRATYKTVVSTYADQRDDVDENAHEGKDRAYSSVDWLSFIESCVLEFELLSTVIDCHRQQKIQLITKINNLE